jgi:hypothetical protein
MSLNHIIQSSVPDDEALDVKFKDLELTGNVYTNGKLYQSYFNQMTDRKRTGNVSGLQQMLYNLGAKGSTTIPANALRVGSILKLSIKGKVRNQISATTGSFNFQFNIGQYVAQLAFPRVPDELTEADYPFTLTFEVHIKSSTELDAYMHYNNYPKLTGRPPSDLLAYNATTQDPILFDFGVPNNVEALVEINGLNSSDAWVNTEYATIEVLY